VGSSGVVVDAFPPCPLFCFGIRKKTQTPHFGGWVLDFQNGFKVLFLL
jgi:hypothetical protein